MKIEKLPKGISKRKSSEQQPWCTSLKTSYTVTTEYQALHSCDHSSDLSGLCLFDNNVSVHADYEEKLMCAMASVDLQVLRHSAQCYLPTKQPSPRIWLHLPHLPLPLPPSLPGCPSILGPPWEDASPNPNQVTNVFPYKNQFPPKKRRRGSVFWNSLCSLNNFPSL